MARKEDNGSSRRGRGNTASDEHQRNAPVRLVQNRIRETEKLISNLKSELSYFRKQNNSITEERDSLLREMSTSAVWNSQSSRLENDFRMLQRERDQLMNLVISLEDDNKLLKEREARLEAAILDMQEKNAEAQETILFLETQIIQLEEMIELLREHRRFLKEE